MSDKGNDTAKNGAKYLSKMLQDPLGMAKVLYNTFSAFAQAGFTEEQAKDLTKHVLDMIILIGGNAE